MSDNAEIWQQVQYHLNMATLLIAQNAQAIAEEAIAQQADTLAQLTIVQHENRRLRRLLNDGADDNGFDDLIGVPP